MVTETLLACGAAVDGFATGERWSRGPVRRTVMDASLTDVIGRMRHSTHGRAR
jgi:hypothetical protein